jgi:hypothetical protein
MPINVLTKIVRINGIHFEEAGKVGWIEKLKAKGYKEIYESADQFYLVYGIDGTHKWYDSRLATLIYYMQDTVVDVNMIEVLTPA